MSVSLSSSLMCKGSRETGRGGIRDAAETLSSVSQGGPGLGHPSLSSLPSQAELLTARMVPTPPLQSPRSFWPAGFGGEEKGEEEGIIPFQPLGQRTNSLLYCSPASIPFSSLVFLSLLTFLPFSHFLSLFKSRTTQE